MNTKRTRRSNCAETEPRKGWVYFVRSGKAIKIGFTTDLDGRLSRLQTASSFPLQLLGTVPGTPRDEQNLHARFANLQVRGEWFRGHPSLMAYIREATAPPPEPEKEEDTAPEPKRPVSPETQAAISSLLRKRNQVGRETIDGNIISNLIEQSRWLSDPDPRPWATHPMQTVAGMMQWQMKRLDRTA